MSRDEVQVVLRASTSTSPDCSAVKRSLADSGTNLTLFGSLKIAAAMRAAEIDIEAGPVALRVGQPEASERAVGAAIQHAAILDGLECLSGCALRCDGKQQCEYCGKSLHVTAPSTLWEVRTLSGRPKFCRRSWFRP